MQFFVAALFAAAAVSAGSTVYQVSDFSAGCIPHGTQCRVAFNVLKPGSMDKAPGLECKTLVTSNNDGTLPDIKDAKCEQSSRTFSLTRGRDGITFKVSAPVSPSSDEIGEHLIPKSELQVSNEPNAIVESYTGVTSFDLKTPA